MKDIDESYTGDLNNSPIKLENGYTPADVALPKVPDTSASRGKTRATLYEKRVHNNGCMHN